MTKTTKKNDSNPDQLSIFDLIKSIQQKSPVEERPGSLNIDIPFREELSLSLKKCPQSRFGVASKMSEGLGTEVTKFSLDAFTGESKTHHRFPASYLPAFIKATNDLGPLRLLVEKCGCHLIESEDLLDQELGKIRRLKEELAQREKEIMGFLKGQGRSHGQKGK